MQWNEHFEQVLLVLLLERNGKAVDDAAHGDNDNGDARSARVDLPAEQREDLSHAAAVLIGEDVAAMFQRLARDEIL